MSKTISGEKKNTRLSYDELNVTQEQLQKVKTAARSGQFDRETLQEACSEFPFVADFLILSVCKGLSFDRLEYSDRGRIAAGRTNFYAYRRRVYANLLKRLS